MILFRYSSIFFLSYLAVSSVLKAQEGVNYARLVDTRIGTEGNGLACGFTFAGATYPFGMMQLTPSFFSPNKGLVVNQISGAGCPNMGSFPVLPIAGALTASPNDMNGYSRYETVNSAVAGYFSMTTKDKVMCETTVSKRSGVVRFTFLPANLRELLSLVRA